MPYLDEQGQFTEDFKTALPEFIGEGYKDEQGNTTKVFDDVKDIRGLAKSFFDTKRMVGKKLEGVIQKPGEKATDQEKAAYRAQLAAEMGAPKDAKEYKFFRDPNTKDGQYSQKAEDSLRAIAHKHGVPAAFMEEASKTLFEAQSEELTNLMAKQADDAQKEFEADSAAIKKDWLGDAIKVKPRHALNAMAEFMTKESFAKLQEAKVFDTPDDLAKWRQLGISPAQLRVWANIGEKMKSPEFIRGSNADAGGKDSPRAKAMRMYPNSPALWPKE